MVVEHSPGEVFLVELGGLADSDQPCEGGGEGNNEGVFEVEDAHDQEEGLEDGLNHVEDWHFGGRRRSLLLLIHWC